MRNFVRIKISFNYQKRLNTEFTVATLISIFEEQRTNKKSVKYHQELCKKERDGR